MSTATDLVSSRVSFDAIGDSDQVLVVSKGSGDPLRERVCAFGGNTQDEPSWPFMCAPLRHNDMTIGVLGVDGFDHVAKSRDGEVRSGPRTSDPCPPRPLPSARAFLRFAVILLFCLHFGSRSAQPEEGIIPFLQHVGQQLGTAVDSKRKREAIEVTVI